MIFFKSCNFRISAVYEARHEVLTFWTWLIEVGVVLKSGLHTCLVVFVEFFEDEIGFRYSNERYFEAHQFVNLEGDWLFQQNR